MPVAVMGAASASAHSTLHSSYLSLLRNGKTRASICLLVLLQPGIGALLRRFNCVSASPIASFMQAPWSCPTSRIAMFVRLTATNNTRPIQDCSFASFRYIFLSIPSYSQPTFPHQFDCLRHPGSFFPIDKRPLQGPHHQPRYRDRSPLGICQTDGPISVLTSTTER